MKAPNKLFARIATVAVAISATYGLTAVPASAQSLAVGKKIEINVDEAKIKEEAEALWQKFGGWCAIKDWHPAVTDCAESKEGDDTYRTLTLDNGGTIKEKLVEQQKRLYRYEIVESPLPVKNYSAQFALTPDDDDLDELNFAWSAVFDAKDAEDDKARDTIDGIFEAGLDSIKKTVGDKNDD